MHALDFYSKNKLTICFCYIYQKAMKVLIDGLCGFFCMAYKCGLLVFKIQNVPWLLSLVFLIQLLDCKSF